MKRKFRLRRNDDFQRVRRHSQSYANSLIVLTCLSNGLDHSRFGFVVSKRIGKAVQRNKTKRRMREAIRLRLSNIKSGFDLVFIARVPAGQATYVALSRSLDQLLEAANLLQKESEL